MAHFILGNIKSHWIIFTFFLQTDAMYDIGKTFIAMRKQTSYEA